MVGTHIAVIYSCVFKTHQILSSLAPLIIRRVGFHNLSLWVQESALSFILEMWVMINIEPFVCTIYIVQSMSKELEKLSQPIFTQLNIAVMTHLNATCYHQMSHHAIIIWSDASWYHQHAIIRVQQKKRVWLRFETQRQGALLLILMNNFKTDE